MGKGQIVCDCQRGRKDGIRETEQRIEDGSVMDEDVDCVREEMKTWTM